VACFIGVVLAILTDVSCFIVVAFDISVRIDK
jgi:hypothetical protein